jgi:hypothetical protein
MRLIGERIGKPASIASRLLAAALAIALLLVLQVRPAAAGEDRGELKIAQPKPGSGTIVMAWHGKVAAPMATQIMEAFERHRNQGTRVVLTLDSGGGSVAEGERVIEVLRRIKETHRLVTAVAQGQKCGSMCVFIYVQGHERIGALTSSWLFHEISRQDPLTKRIVLNRPQWENLVDKYFRPAGVSDKWIAEMKQYTVESDYWQTGADLVQANSGIIHRSLSNHRRREVAPPPSLLPGQHGTPNEPAEARTAS